MVIALASNLRRLIPLKRIPYVCFPSIFKNRRIAAKSVGGLSGQRGLNIVIEGKPDLARQAEHQLKYTAQRDSRAIVRRLL